MSQFSLASAVRIVSAATSRVLPTLLASPSPGSLRDALLALNPLVTVAWLAVLLAAVQIVLAGVTRTANSNDRFWQVVPFLQAAVFFAHPLLADGGGQAADARLCLMFALVALWAARLTRHAVSRGVYAHSAVDYRYTWVRQTIIKNDVAFALCYAVIGCAYFTFLLTIVVAPLYFAWLSRHAVPLGPLDAVAAACMLSALVVQAVADRQQQAFQAAKAAARGPPASVPAGGCPFANDVADGFLQSGLFAYSRHPNFFGEIGVWSSFHLFSIAAGASPFNWTLLGPALYVLLFQGSTVMTETISASKYPRYTDYQKRVSQIIPLPFPFSKPRADDSDAASVVTSKQD